MENVILHDDSEIESARDLLRAMLATIRNCWTRAESYPKIPYLIGALLFASALFHTGVLIATGGPLERPVSLRAGPLSGEDK